MKIIVPLSLPTSELLESITLPLPTTRKKSIIITDLLALSQKTPISTVSKGKKPISKGPIITESKTPISKPTNNKVLKKPVSISKIVSLPRGSKSQVGKVSSMEKIPLITTPVIVPISKKPISKKPISVSKTPSVSPVTNLKPIPRPWYMEDAYTLESLASQGLRKGSKVKSVITPISKTTNNKTKLDVITPIPLPGVKQVIHPRISKKLTKSKAKR
jgi:hypothetical protein